MRCKNCLFKVISNYFVHLTLYLFWVGEPFNIVQWSSSQPYALLSLNWGFPLADVWFFCLILFHTFPRALLGFLNVKVPGTLLAWFPFGNKFQLSSFYFIMLVDMLDRICYVFFSCDAWVVLLSYNHCVLWLLVMPIQVQLSILVLNLLWNRYAPLHQ